MGLGDIIRKLPGVSTIGLVWSLVSFVLLVEELKRKR